MEDVHLVASRDHVPNADLAPPIGNRIVGSIHRNDYRAHLRVNVAEDKGNAGLVELDKLSCAALVESQIEPLAVEQRKYIVKKRILVGELDLSAGWNHKQGRLKALVLLHQLGDF